MPNDYVWSNISYADSYQLNWYIIRIVITWMLISLVYIILDYYGCISGIIICFRILSHSCFI